MKKYSQNKFENYKLRVKFIAKDEKGADIINRDIYTDETDKRKIEKHLNRGLYDLINRLDVVCSSSNITNWATKVQDDRQSKFFDKLFN